MTLSAAYLAKSSSDVQGLGYIFTNKIATHTNKQKSRRGHVLTTSFFCFVKVTHSSNAHCSSFTRVREFTGTQS